jgi:MFS family permease
MKIRFTRYRNAGIPTMATIIAAALIAACCIAMGLAPIFIALLGVAIGVFFTSFIINSKQLRANKELRKSLFYMLFAAIFAGLVTACLIIFTPLLIISSILLVGISAGSFLAAFFMLNRYNNAPEGSFGFRWLVKNLFFAAIILGLGVGIIFVASMVSIPLALAISFAASCAFTSYFYTAIGKPSNTKATLLTLALLIIAPAIVIGISVFAIGLAMPIVIALGIATATIGGVCLAAWKAPVLPEKTAASTTPEHGAKSTTSTASNDAAPKTKSAAQEEFDNIYYVVADVISAIATGASDIYHGKPSSRVSP